MTITYRDEADHDLTAEEIDANFRTLAALIQTIIDNPPSARGVTSISVESLNILRFNMSDSTQEGPFLLPAGKVNPRGPWGPGEIYMAQDVVVVDGDSYLVRFAHTSDSEFDPDADHGDGFLYKIFVNRPDLPFDIAFFQNGTPGHDIGAGEALFTYRAARSFWLPAGLVQSVAGLERSAAMQLVFPIMKNRTAIGTLTIGGADSESESESEAEADAVFDFPADVQFESGDRLRIIEPGTADTNALDLSITFRAQQGTAP